MLRTESNKKEYDSKTNTQMAEKEVDLDKVVRELEEVKRFESQRQYDIKVLQTQYTNNLRRDITKMETFVQEKEDDLVEVEEESTAISRSIMKNIENHKDIRQEIA